MIYAMIVYQQPSTRWQIQGRRGEFWVGRLYPPPPPPSPEILILPDLEILTSLPAIGRKISILITTNFMEANRLLMSAGCDL